MKKYIVLLILLIALPINLQALQIGTKQIKDKAITTAKLDDGAVEDTQLEATLKAKIPTTDEKAAMTNASSPDAGNPFATTDDIGDKLDVADSTLFIWRDGSLDFTANQSMGGYKMTDADEATTDSDYMTKWGTDQGLAARDNILELANGSTLRPIALSVASNGTVITASLSSEVGSTITFKFSDGQTTVNVGTPKTATLTEGTDEVPVMNYLYVLQTDPTTLVNSAVGWPAVEYFAVGMVNCQTAATLQGDGPLKQHTFEDEVAEDTTLIGHIAHVNAWIRDQWGTYKTGVAPTFSGTGTGTIGYASTSGTVRQLHIETFPAFNNGADVYCVNDPDTKYRKITNIGSLLKDSAGVVLKNKTYGIVFWGALSDDGQSKIYCNLPNGSELNEANARLDNDKHINYSIPTAFRGVGFLIYKLIIKNNNDATWTLYTGGTGDDQRGQYPNTSAGTSTAIGVKFPDGASGFTLFNAADVTKQVQVTLAGIAGGNTRTLTFPDANVDLGEIATNKEARDGTSFGITPSEAPDANYKFANKKYVDDNAGGYTNLTEFIDQTAWRLFYSNAAGDVTELVLGGDGTYLKSNGAAVAPTFETPAGAGDVVGPGEAVDNRIAVFDGVTGKLIKDGGSLISALIAKSIGTTKGDIIVFTGAGVPIRLGVGADTHVLTADSGEASGVKWAEGGGGAGGSPWRFIDLPAGSWDYPASNPAPLDTDTFTNGTQKRHLFDDTTEEFVIADIVMPSDLDASGTVSFIVYGYAVTWVTGKNIELKLYHSAKANDEQLDAAYASKESGDKALNTSAQDVLDVLTFTETVANLGWAAGDKVRIKLSRIVASANDLVGDYGITNFGIKIPRA